MTNETQQDLLRVEKVNQVFGAETKDPVVALQDIDLNVQRGEFVTLVGPSGCGKSTLLFAISKLRKPTSGVVCIETHDDDADRIAQMGIVFQKPVLMPWANILDNILFPMKLLGRRIRPEDRDHARSLMALAGIDGFEKRYPNELSGGMQQRAAICRALIVSPSLLLMDEPFSAVDALTREKLVVDLQNIWKRENLTIIFVTHSIEEAVTLADRVVVLAPRPGRVIWEEQIDLPRVRDRNSKALPEFHNYTKLIYDKLGL